MADITAALVKELRETSGAGMMDCKKALTETGGNMEEAVRELERAILIEPLDPTINEHLGDIYWLVGRKIEARYQWDRALSFDPEEERIPGLKERLACTDEVCAPLEADGRPGAHGTERRPQEQEDRIAWSVVQTGNRRYAGFTVDPPRSHAS